MRSVLDDPNRIIISRCCEDYICDYWSLLPETFSCPMCCTEWQKLSQLVFQRESVVFSLTNVLTNIPYEPIGIPHLQPITPGKFVLSRRCCVLLLSRYGKSIKDFTICPDCKSLWAPIVPSDGKLWAELHKLVRRSGPEFLNILFVKDQYILYTLRDIGYALDPWVESDDKAIQQLYQEAMGCPIRKSRTRS